MRRTSPLSVLALLLHGCAGSEGPGPVRASPSTPPTLVPSASIRLSGSAASGVAAAGGWLWVTHFGASTLSQVDPRTNAEVAVVDVGPNGASVTAIGSQVWIAQYTTRPEDARLTWTDPLTATVLGRLTLPHLCCEVAGAAGRVWAVDPRGALLAIDAAEGRVASRTPIAIDPAVHIGLVGDERALWVASDTTSLLRIDPARAAVTASIDAGGGIPMALANDLVWGAGPHHVWAVDPVSNAVRVRLPIEDTIEILNLAVSGDSLWIGARRPGHVGVVRRFDLATGRQTGEAAVALPARVLSAFERVWVADWETNRLLRFD